MHKAWYASAVGKAEEGRNRWTGAERQATYVERIEHPLGLGSDVRGVAAAGLWFDALALLLSVDLSGRVRVLEKDGLANSWVQRRADCLAEIHCAFQADLTDAP